MAVHAVAEVLKSKGGESNREAILCQRFSAHSAAVAAVLVLQNDGEAGVRLGPAGRDVSRPHQLVFCAGGSGRALRSPIWQRAGAPPLHTRLPAPPCPPCLQRPATKS